VLALAAILSVSTTAKPTRSRVNSNQVQLSVSVDSVARAAGDLEPAILLSRDVQSCLRDAISPNPAQDFYLRISGEITNSGRLQVSEIESLGRPKLEACVRNAFAGLNLEEGPAGPFAIQLERVQPGGSRSKTFILDLRPLKIWQ
jgi:hypothetical protein